MTGIQNIALFRARHAEWLRLYKASPIPPTLRELGAVWGVNSSNAAWYIIKQLVKMGLAGYEQHRSRRFYYPLPMPQEGEETK
jgi:hypothetical protein